MEWLACALFFTAETLCSTFLCLSDPMGFCNDFSSGPWKTIWGEISNTVLFKATLKATIPFTACTQKKQVSSANGAERVGGGQGKGEWSRVGRSGGEGFGNGSTYWVWSDCTDQYSMAGAILLVQIWIDLLQLLGLTLGQADNCLP